MKRNTYVLDKLLARSEITCLTHWATGKELEDGWTSAMTEMHRMALGDKMQPSLITDKLLDTTHLCYSDQTLA